MDQGVAGPAGTEGALAEWRMNELMLAVVPQHRELDQVVCD